MNYPQTLVSFIADIVGAAHRCAAHNKEWAHKHAERLNYISRHLLPRGAGFDEGTVLDLERSTENKLVLLTEFHHMNARGFYDGWTKHTVTVRPGFSSLDIRVSGPDRNDVKSYIGDIFNDALAQTDDYDESRGDYRAPWYWRTEERKS